MGRKLFVGNLPYDSTEADLQEVFARVGTVDTVTIMKDNMTGRPRGFGFVEMSTDEEAAKAAEELNETDFGGRKLTVNEARPRPQGGGGFGGGGGGFGGGGGRGPGGPGGRGGRGGRGGGGGGGGPREPRW
jgi:cold-inducible RNA-binding protein